MEILLSYPYWFLIFCLLAGGLYSFVLYNRESAFSETAAWIRKLLAALRFVSVSLLCFFLLSPFIKSSFREVEKPTVVIAVDNSQSVRNDSARVPLSLIANKIDAAQMALADKFDVKVLSFGEAVRENKNFSFNEKLTNISDVFSETQTLYSGRNLGAVILFSDGIFNAGSNPVYRSSALKVPVYTVALGDTVVNKDVILADVAHNKVAYLGNSFPLEIKINAKQASGENTLLTVKEDSALVFSRNVTVSGNQFHLNVPVFIDSKTKGIHRYTVSLSRVNGEKNVKNNSAEVYVEVKEGKQKILILAHAPHPDIAALRSMLEKNNSYEVDDAQAENFTGNLSDYNLVILHQLPSGPSSLGLLDRLRKNTLPVLYILGSKTNINDFNNQQTGVTIASALNKSNEVLPYVNESFSLFTLPADFEKTLTQYPPVYAPFGSYKISGEVYPLLQQKIGSVKTQQPLLFFSNPNGIRTGVMAGEGFWKWRMNEFSEKNSTVVTDELFSKVIQYLIVKDKKQRFKVAFKSNVTESEALIFDAELYNDAGELVNEPEVNMVISGTGGKEYKYAFSRSSKTYYLNAGNFPPGRYTFKADTKLGDKIYSDKGAFSVSSLMLENTETTADHQLLYTMAKNSGGEMVTIDETEKIISAINSNESIKPVSYYHKKLTELIQLKWVLGLLMFLLSLEWFLRKRSGAY